MNRCISCGAQRLAPIMSLGTTPLAHALLTEESLDRAEPREVFTLPDVAVDEDAAGVDDAAHVELAAAPPQIVERHDRPARVAPAQHQAQGGADESRAAGDHDRLF